MSSWKDFKKAMSNKRAGKKATPHAKILEDEAITVQRLSADVSGKTQKYTRIGVKEFVPFEYEEVTISNIWRACLDHYCVSENMFCDILAGEQGPSCSTLKQIPSLNVIHVRFIEKDTSKAGPSHATTSNTVLPGQARPAKRGQKRKVHVLESHSAVRLPLMASKFILR